MLAEKVMLHALQNYEKDGWDIVAECYDFAVINEIIRDAGASTEEEAIAAVRKNVLPIHEYRADIQGS